MQEAIRKGEVQQITNEKNVTFYMFPTLNFTRNQKLESENKITRGHALNNAQYDQIKDTMDSVEFSGLDAFQPAIDADED